MNIALDEINLYIRMTSYGVLCIIDNNVLKSSYQFQC